MPKLPDEYINEYDEFYITQHNNPEDKDAKPYVFITGGEDILDADEDAKLLMKVPAKVLLDAAEKWSLTQELFDMNKKKRK